MYDLTSGLGALGMGAADIFRQNIKDNIDRVFK